MKAFRKMYVPVIIYSIIIMVSGCATVVDFAYKVQKPVIVEGKIAGPALFFLSMADLRLERDLLGYIDNSYGMKVTKVTARDPDISKSISAEFKKVLTRKGFIFTDDVNKCDFKLTFSINKYYAEMESPAFSFFTNGECCMDISLNSGADNKELYKTNVCGKGEKKTTMVLNKKDIPEVLILATDDALDKVLNGTELIDYVNRNIKR
jgi:hypothetical protein